VNWLIHTDCPPVEDHPENVAFEHMTRRQYVQHVNSRLNIGFRSKSNYKLCDLKPMYGVIWEEPIGDFDFFGYGDIDVIYGDIRHFYTDAVLENNIISTHEWCFSGHLSLIRNRNWLKNAYLQIPDWRALVESEEPARLDEDYFSDVFVRPNRHSPKIWVLPIRLNELLNPGRRRYRRGLYLKEQFTTPLTPNRWLSGSFDHPTVWYWREGKVTNNLDGERQFIYLHFMNFASARYAQARYGPNPPWKNLEDCVQLTPADLKKGIQIDEGGMRPIPPRI